MVPSTRISTTEVPVTRIEFIEVRVGIAVSPSTLAKFPTCVKSGQREGMLEDLARGLEGGEHHHQDRVEHDEGVRDQDDLGEEREGDRLARGGRDRRRWRSKLDLPTAQPQGQHGREDDDEEEEQRGQRASPCRSSGCWRSGCQRPCGRKRGRARRWCRRASRRAPTIT